VPPWRAAHRQRRAGRVRAACDLADLPVERVELLLCLLGGLVGGVGRGLLLRQLLAGGVDLLLHDLQLVAGVGDELRRLLRGAGPLGVRGRGPRQQGDGQGRCGTHEEPGAEPGERAGAGRLVGIGSSMCMPQGRAKRRHVRRLSFFLSDRLPS